LDDAGWLGGAAPVVAVLAVVFELLLALPESLDE
jgi:hypothetical protein